MRAELPLSRQITSVVSIWVISVCAGLAVFGAAIFLQWLIYDDWLHDGGPLRIVGSFLTGALMFAVTFRWELGVRRRKVEMLRRFETIRWMNDRIRNSLQAIECVTYAATPEATAQVRDAVEIIEGVLQEVLADSDAEYAGEPELRSDRSPAQRSQLSAMPRRIDVQNVTRAKAKFGTDD